MPQVPFWFDYPDDWDRCSLGFIELPGVSRVKINRGWKLDRNKPSGKHGAQLTSRGYQPAEVTITCRIWTDEQLNFLVNEVMPAIEPSPTKKDPKPLDIMHPVAAIRGLKSVQIDKIEGPEEGSIKGVYETVIYCVEFLPPPKKSATVASTTSQQGFANALTGKPPPTPPSTTKVKP